MALYKVDSDTADLTKVAGGTLYADLPIGSWIKNDMATIPSGFLKVGDTISQSEYPELYAKYGSTVPYKADTSELSEYENITLSTNSSNPTVMPYDGVYILANYGVSNIHHIYLNGVKISVGITGNSTTGASMSSTILFKKGDTMYRLNTYIESSTFVEHVAYYKKSLIVKAKHTPVPADFMSAVDEAVNTSNIAKMLPYSFNRSSNIGAFNRKWLVEGSPITWTATHTGRLTIRCLKHGDGYSLYLTNQSQSDTLLDSYDNFFGDEVHGVTVSDASITLQGWVKKGDVIKLETNLPSSTDWANKYFVQLGLLAYNSNYD